MDEFNFKWYEFLKQQNQNISPSLQEMVKKWENSKIESKKINEIYNKYFKNNKE